MKRPEPVAELLTGAPFTVEQAAAHGVSRRRLGTSPLFRSVCTGIHVAAEVLDSPELRLAAVGLIIPSGAVVSGTTATWIHGADLYRRSPTSCRRDHGPRGVAPGSRGLLVARRGTLGIDDVIEVRRYPRHHAVADGVRPRSQGPAEGVVAAGRHVAQEACITPRELLDICVGQGSASVGVRQIACVASLADAGAQSPMESRLAWCWSSRRTAHTGDAARGAGRRAGRRTPGHGLPAADGRDGVRRRACTPRSADRDSRPPAAQPAEARRLARALLCQRRHAGAGGTSSGARPGKPSNGDQC